MFGESILALGSQYVPFHFMWGFAHTLVRKDIMQLNHQYFSKLTFPCIIAYDTAHGAATNTPAAAMPSGAVCAECE
jgi:hypothetical protein